MKNYKKVIIATVSLFVAGLLLAGCSTTDLTNRTNSSPSSKKPETNNTRKGKETNVNSKESANRETQKDKVEKSWSQLSETDKLNIFAQWVNNSQGSYKVFNGTKNVWYFVNVGTNAKQGTTPGAVVSNTVKIVLNSDESYSLEVDDNTVGLNMAQEPFSLVNWKVKEKLTTDELVAEYEKNISINQIQSVSNETTPQNLIN